MDRRGFLRAAGAGVAAAWMGPAMARVAAGAPGKRPNIIVIMVDDMGYSDLGCFGGEIRTPHIDGLARGGIRFTNFHNTSRCCPSRASILTGLYPHQTGLGRFVGDGKGAPTPAYQGSMARPCVTMAEVLRPAGYATCMSGKWHVGGPNPEGRGFDRMDAYFADGARAYFKEVREGVWDTSWYITDWFADAVVRYVNDYAGEKPFFVYWTPTAPHWPLHAKAADAARYKGAYDAGPKAVAEARYRRQVEMGLVDPAWPWSPPAELDVDAPDRDGRTARERLVTEIRLDNEQEAEPGFKKVSWKSGRYGSTRNNRTFEEPMEVYAGMIDCLDRGVGRVVQALKDKGVFEDTLILFCSDNGCSNEGLGTGVPWATVSDTPMLRWKKSAYEGGVGTPLIMHWPERTPEARRGSINRSFGHLVDIMATTVAASGAAYPDRDAKGREVPAMEGRSLLPALAGEHVPLGAPIFIEHTGNCAAITEAWKITSDGGEPWRLYDMKRDRLEREDVSAAHPEVVARLEQAWDAWAARTGALRSGGREKKR